VFGRRLEIDRTWRMLTGVPEASCRLEISGEPGIGKTTLFEATLARARELGFVVMSARPTIAERALGGAGLGDLLRTVDDLTFLGDHHGRVLGIALARRAPDGAPPSIFDVGVAMIALLSSVSASGSTVLVAVDDAQWLDDTSREVLAFVLRRLPATHVAAVICHRVGGDTWFDSHEHLEIAPLDPGAIRLVVDDAAVKELAPVTADRIAEAAGGNPLFAVELARTVVVDGTPRTLVPLSVPTSLHDLVAARIAGFPPATIEAMAMVALLAEPTVDRLDRLGVLDDLAPAERSGVVLVADRTAAFTHPLLASAAHDAVPGTRRLDLHRRLGGVMTGLARLVHLALGTTSVDVVVAAELAAPWPMWSREERWPRRRNWHCSRCRSPRSTAIVGGSG